MENLTKFLSTWLHIRRNLICIIIKEQKHQTCVQNVQASVESRLNGGKYQIKNFLDMSVNGGHWILIIVICQRRPCSCCSCVFKPTAASGAAVHDFLRGGTSGRCSCLDCRRRHSWPLCLFLLNLCNFWFYSIFGNVFVENCLEKCCKEALEGMLRGRAFNQCPHGHKEQDLAPAIHGDFDLRFLGLSDFHTSNMARATIEPIFWALGPRATGSQISIYHCLLSLLPRI